MRRNRTEVVEPRRAGRPQCGCSRGRSPIDAIFDPTAHTVRDLAQRAVTSLHSGMPVLVDRGFPSAEWLRALRQTGADVLARIPSHLRPKTIQGLGHGTHLVLIGRLKLRLIEAEITIEGDRTSVYRLATTLLDADAHPALDLIALYHQRWRSRPPAANSNRVCWTAGCCARGTRPDSPRKFGRCWPSARPCAAASTTRSLARRSVHSRPASPSPARPPATRSSPPRTSSTSKSRPQGQLELRGRSRR
ncbi:Transposase DDE domain-containing protein [Glycomyces harbinensis]|uniref:Transposase DDE domain-containing protein n=1 Tax=Glycomyces harbinensis TaxID=58114 RepID=A0A1G7B209_9ACTN|nr:Transposase DDE domain-containing protein [Glycomyces harbinensis]